MAGIIESKMQRTPQQDGGNLSSPTDEAALSEAQTQEGGDAQERVVLAGMKMLYEDGPHKQVIEQLKSGAENPAMSIAAVTFDLLQTLDNKAGGKIPEDALVPAAIELLEEVDEIAAQSGVIKHDENTLPQALQALIALAIEAGVIDPADLEAEIQGMDQEEMQGLIAQQEQIAAGRQQPAMAA